MKKEFVILSIFIGILVSCGTSQKMVNSSEKKETIINDVINTGRILFSDNFENYGLGQALPAGKWKLGFARSGGAAKITEGVQSNTKIGRILRTDGIVQVFVPGSWNNFVYSLDWKEGEPLIYFKLDKTGSKGYYLIYEKGKPFQLYKFTPAGKYKIAENTLPINNGWHHIQIITKIDQMRIYVDKQLIIDVKDNEPALAKGGIGLGKTYYYPVYFDNIKVMELK